MDFLDKLVGELDAALAEAYRLDKGEMSDVRKESLKTEKILDKKQHQLSDLYAEHKKLALRLEELECSSQKMKSILEELHLEEVKTKNATRITKKSVKKAERLSEFTTQLSGKDKDVLFKRRLSLYILKKFLGIHIEQGAGNTLNIISWSDGSVIQSTCVQSPETGEDHILGSIFWESISRKSVTYDKWAKLFEK